MTLDTTGLVNVTQEVKTLTSYDRSFAGHFHNPYRLAPQLVFYMQRITVDDAGNKIAETRVADLAEDYIPGKTYQLYDPQTSQPVEGQTFTVEQLYAMLFSVNRCTAAEAAAAEAAAAEAAAARVAARVAAEAAAALVHAQ